MKYHKKFKLADTLEFPEPVTHVFMTKKNQMVIVTGNKMYIYKGASKVSEKKLAK